MNTVYDNLNRRVSKTFAELAIVIQMSTVLPLYFFSAMGMSGVYTAIKVVIYGFYAYNALRIICSQYLSIFIKALCIIGGLFLFNYTLFPNNRTAMIQLLPNIVMVILGYTNALAVTDTKKLVRYLKTSAHVIFVLAIVFAALAIILSKSIEYIAFSNGILATAVYFTADWFTGNKKSARYAIILAVLLLAFCSRSSILYWSFSVLFLLTKKAQQMRKAKIIIAISIFIVITVPLILYWKPVLIWVYNTLRSFGIDSRTLYKIIDGSIADLNGRDEIYPLLLGKVRQNPWFGYGIGSPNVFNVEYFYRWTKNNTDYIGSGAHNGILACAVEFGILAAGLFVLFNIKAGCKLFWRALTREDEIIFAILLSTGMIRVMVGATYWQTINYGIFCGFYYNRMQYYKNINRNTNFNCEGR